MVNEQCPQCGKRIPSDRRQGSLTSYLFGALDCNCSQVGGNDSLRAAPVKYEDSADFCPKCGLKIVDQARGGSLTGFLFQSTRCKCPVDENFADGRMSDKFWKLKKGSDPGIFTRSPSTSSGQRKGKTKATSIDLVPGAVIGGVYKIVQLVGLGGMGEVYLAMHEHLDKKCALKVIPPDQVTEVGWQRFQLEAKAVAKLEHINLVRVTDLGIHDGCLPYYAMDFIDGQNLADILVEKKHLSLGSTIDIFSQVCDGLECAHRGGILHRDLKPGNLMLTRTSAGKLLVKILDFGLAKLTKQDRTRQSLTAVGDVFGSPYYMSPEQCSGDKLDNRSDIYSMGCAMFECLTGKPPFDGHQTTAIIFSQLEADPPTLESIMGPGKIPASMEVVMAKLLRKNPAERYQTMGQVKTDLALVAAGKEVLPVYQSRQKSVPPSKKSGVSKGGAPTLTGIVGGVGENARASALLRLVLATGMVFLILVGGTFYWVLNRGSSKHMPFDSIKTGEDGTSMIKTKSHPITSEGPAALGERQRMESELLAKAGGGDGAVLDFVASGPAVVKHWDKTPFFRGIVKKDNIPYAHWTFPNALLPALSLRFDQGGRVRTEALSGDVYVPADSPVCLVLKPEITRTPRYFDGLRDNTFNELDARVLPATLFLLVAQKLSTFRSLSGIEIGNVTWTLADCNNSARGLEQLPNLRRLRLYCVFDWRLLQRVFQTHPLEQLVIQLGSRDCLEVVARARSLKAFAVLVCMNAPADISLFVGNTNLENLMIGQLSGTHQELSQLSQIKNLKQLDLPDLAYRQDLTQDLRKFKNLKVLKLLDGKDWSAEHISELHEALPELQIHTYPSLEIGEAQLFKP